MVNKKLDKSAKTTVKSPRGTSKKEQTEIATSSARRKRKQRSESDTEIDNESTKITDNVADKKNKGKKIKKDVAVPNMKVIDARQSPKWLTDVIVAANPAQQKVIRDMGFGSFLDGAFNFDSVPVALGGFVVDIFDHKTCKFNLPNGRSIKVTKELIHDTTGLPIGGKKIKKRYRSSGVDLGVQIFRKQYCEKELKAYCVKPLEGIMGIMK